MDTEGGATVSSDPGTIFARAKWAKILRVENRELKAEIEKLQAECRAYRQLLDRYQEDETNRRALEQAKKRAAAEGMMEPLPESKGKR